MKLITRVLNDIFRVIYFILVVILLILLVYYFGGSILSPILPGSDNPNFVVLASWLSKWWPRIPFWYPQQGAGLSFTTSYPILNLYLTVLIEKIFNLPIAVAFRIWSLATILLTSIGLYFLSIRLTKNQTIASLSAIFYVICPITWVFLIGWGFTEEQLTYLFVPPALILITLLLDEYGVNGLNLKAKIYLFLLVINNVIIVLAHPAVFVWVIVFGVMLSIVYPLLNYKYKIERKSFRQTSLLGIKVALIIILSSLFWVFPFFRYQLIASKGAPVEKGKYDYRMMMQHSVYARNVFGITDKTVGYESLDDPLKDFSGFAYRNVSFPFVISLLALIGLVGALFINRKVFAIGLVNLLPLVISVFPKNFFFLLNIPFGAYFFHWRSALIMSRFVIPLLAAFGCFSLAHLFLFPLHRLLKKIKGAFVINCLGRVYFILAGVFTLIVAGVSLWQFKNWPNNPGFLLSYGVENSAPGMKVDLRNIWRQEIDYCFSGSSLNDVLDIYKESCRNYTFQKHFWHYKLFTACYELGLAGKTLPADISSLCGLNPDAETVKKAVADCQIQSFWTQYQGICQAQVANIFEQLKPELWASSYYSKNLFTEGSQIYGNDRKIFDALPKTSNSRIDIGTLLGSFLMIEPFYSNMPELPVYYNQGSLIKTLWNYQIAVFNQKETVWPQDSIMSELSKYFGLEYALMAEDKAPLDKYARTGWERVDKVGIDSWGGGGVGLWKFKDAAGVLRVTTKPTILVIGQDKVDGYFRIFHLANLGVLPYEDALLVKGGPYADSYSAEELKNFDIVFLEGYTYKSRDRRKGWNILDTYVKNGGSLFINTGWQYSSADWQLTDTPNFIPLTTLEWGNSGSTVDFSDEDSEIAGDINVKKFSSLIFSEAKWGVSSSDRKNLRSWAKVILSSNGKPLIAGGNYGKGKVIWTGLDLPGHIGAYHDNEEEIKLYKNLVNYLLEGRSRKVLKASYTRDYPDKLEITINELSNSKTVVYWSEAYFPDFRAKLVSGGKTEKLKVYKAGPGMTMFILPKVTEGSKIIYEYKTPVSVIIARLISFLMILTLTILIITPSPILRITEVVRKDILNNLIKKRIVGDDENEDVNY